MHLGQILGSRMWCLDRRIHAGSSLRVTLTRSPLPLTVGGDGPSTDSTEVGEPALYHCPPARPPPRARMNRGALQLTWASELHVQPLLPGCRGGGELVHRGSSSLGTGSRSKSVRLAHNLMISTPMPRQAAWVFTWTFAHIHSTFSSSGKTWKVGSR